MVSKDVKLGCRRNCNKGRVAMVAYSQALFSEGGVGVNEGVGESGWIVEKDKPEYDEIFNSLEISGGKVTGELTGISDKDID